MLARNNVHVLNMNGVDGSANGGANVVGLVQGYCYKVQITNISFFGVQYAFILYVSQLPLTIGRFPRRFAETPSLS